MLKKVKEGKPYRTPYRRSYPTIPHPSIHVLHEVYYGRIPEKKAVFDWFDMAHDR